MAVDAWSWLDVLVAVVVMVALVRGYRRGFVSGAATLAGGLVAVLVAGRLTGPILNWLNGRWYLTELLHLWLQKVVTVPPDLVAIPAHTVSAADLHGALAHLSLPASVAEPLYTRLMAALAYSPEGTVADAMLRMLAHALLQATLFVLLAVALLRVALWLSRRYSAALARVAIPGVAGRMLGAGAGGLATLLVLTMLLQPLAPALMLFQAGRGYAAARATAWLAPVQQAAAPVVFGRDAAARAGMAVRWPEMRIFTVNDRESHVDMVVAGAGGEVAVVLRSSEDDGPGRVEGVIFHAPGSPAGLFRLNEDGLVASLEAEGYLATFTNYTRDTVDITVTDPDGTVVPMPAVPMEAAGPKPGAQALLRMGPSVAHAAEPAELPAWFTGRDLTGWEMRPQPVEPWQARQFVSNLATVLSGAACPLGLVATQASAGLLSGLAVMGCGFFLASAAGATLDAPLLDWFGFGGGVLTDLAGCTEGLPRGDVMACVSSILNVSSKLIPDYEVTYEFPTLSVQADDPHLRLPIAGARVTLLSGDKLYRRTLTGSNPVAAPPGTALLFNIESGAYRLQIEKEGYESQAFNVTVEPDLIVVDAASTGRRVLAQDWRDIGMARFSVALTPLGDFFWDFRVVEHETGEPLVGARVTVHNTAIGHFDSRLTQADTTGPIPHTPHFGRRDPGRAYLFPFNEGSYEIVVAKKGFETRNFRMAVTHNRVLIVTAETRQPVLDHDRQRSATVTLTVALRPEAGEPPAAAPPAESPPPAAEPPPPPETEPPPPAAEPPGTDISSFVGTWQGTVTEVSGGDACMWDERLARLTPPGQFEMHVRADGRVTGNLSFVLPVGPLRMDPQGRIATDTGNIRLNIQLSARAGTVHGSAQHFYESPQQTGPSCDAAFTLTRR